MNDSSLFAYNCDYDNFIKYYSLSSHDKFLEACVCRGIAYDLTFCKNIISSNISFSNDVYKVIQSKLIMNNIIDLKCIEKYRPFCIWFPDIPSKETCIELINKFDFLNYSLASLFLLMDWKDLFMSLNINDDKFLYDLSLYIGRDYVKESDTSTICLREEKIIPNSFSRPFQLFKFTQPPLTPTIYQEASDDFPPFYYTYRYPLCLPFLSDTGIEYHMINIHNPNYEYSDCRQEVD